MTDINDIKRELGALTAKVAAYEAAKARNWPERIEAGMVFKAKFTEATWMATGRGTECMCIANGKHGGWGVMNDVSDALDYLGHARDILAIRTDTHELTGAELVGRVCQFTNGAGSAVGPVMMCIGYDGSGHGPYSYQAETGSWFIGARLAK